MARKGTQPALYELIRHKPPQGSLTPTSSYAPQPPEAPLHTSGPGRFVKLPVGSVYIAISAVLLAIVIAYMYGYSSGERGARERFEQKRIDELNAHAALPEVDPLKAGKTPKSLAGGDLTSDGLSNRGIDRKNDSPSDGNRPATTRGGAQDTKQDLGPAPGTDPRQPGLNYFVLAHTATRNGEQMVDFCRRNGLDAHLVPDDNGQLRLVVVAPGFAGGDRRSADVTALEKKIRSVGVKWKDAANGNRDFGDAYPKKHQPANAT